jgi:hypothetical protein
VRDEDSDCAVSCIGWARRQPAMVGCQWLHGILPPPATQYIAAHTHLRDHLCFVVSASLFEIFYFLLVLFSSALRSGWSKRAFSLLAYPQDCIFLSLLRQ